MMSDNNHYGVGGRLKKKPSEFMIETAYLHDCEQAEYLLDGIYIADLAYAIHLTNLKLVPIAEAKDLIGALINSTSDQILVNPEYGDLYNSRDIYLKNLLGDTAGWLHLGRARREAVNMGFILKLRQLTLQLYKQCIGLSKELLEIIVTHRELEMPDFTYLLHAQPTTLGHYLGTFLSPLIRDLDRTKQYYSRLDRSWAGIGSVNGSSLPISREVLASYMGFEQVANHTRDAMWMPDIVNEAYSIVCSVLNNLSRFIEDIIVWNTNEFSFLEIDDSFARASVIMPQKKNPYAFSYIRGLSKDLVGKYTTALMLGQQQSGFPDSRTFVYENLLDSYDRAIRSIKLFEEAIKSISWNADKMRTSASRIELLATEYAEALSIRHSINYKEAHHIIGAALSMYGESGISFVQSLSKILHENNLSDVDAYSILPDWDIKKSISAKISLGAVSPESMYKYEDDTKKSILYYNIDYEEKRDRHNQVEMILNEELNKIEVDEFFGIKFALSV